MPSLPAFDTPDATPAIDGRDDRAPDGADGRAPASTDRARRLAEAHAWVLEHHAETFKKLAE